MGFGKKKKKIEPGTAFIKSNLSWVFVFFFPFSSRNNSKLQGLEVEVEASLAVSGAHTERLACQERELIINRVKSSISQNALMCLSKMLKETNSF